MTIESGVYKIKADRPPGHHVISLENGDPRGYLVVGPVKQDDDLNQQWAIVYQSGEIYTFKSLIKNFEGGDEIPQSKKPYARNSEDDASDPYVRGGIIDVFATYKIVVVKPNEDVYKISLPGRDKFWTVNKANKIILEEKLEPDKEGRQLWRFERIGDLPK